MNGKTIEVIRMTLEVIDGYFLTIIPRTNGL